MPTSQHGAAKKRTRSAPWERPAPAKVARKRPLELTAAQKAHANKRAKKAGRSYPNLVDNMREAAATKKKPSGARTPRKKASGSASGHGRKATTRRASERTRATRNASTSPTRAPRKTMHRRTAA